MQEELKEEKNILENDMTELQNENNDTQKELECL
jgi:hypothetical protein